MRLPGTPWVGHSELVLIRRELESDSADIHAVTAAAFSGLGAADPPTEATLVDELRASDAWLPGTFAYPEPFERT